MYIKICFQQKQQKILLKQFSQLCYYNSMKQKYVLHSECENEAAVGAMFKASHPLDGIDRLEFDAAAAASVSLRQPPPACSEHPPCLIHVQI